MKKNTLQQASNSKAFNKEAVKLTDEEIAEAKEIQDKLGDNEICLIETNDKEHCLIITKP